MRRLLKSHKGFVSSVAIFLAVLLICPANVVAFDQPHDSGHNTIEKAPTRPCTPPSGICPAKGSPIHVKYGNYVYSHQDLFIPGRGFSLEVTRTYDSQDLYDGPFGHGWKFNFEVKLTETTDESGERVTIRRADGVRLEFSRNPDGTYIPPQGRQDHLAKNADSTFTWYQSGCTTCGGTSYHFSASGYLMQIQDSYGNQMTFDYDNTGKLIQVTDASGRKLNITYGADKKILSITDPADRTFAYGYDSRGNLTTYTDPLKNTTRYVYDTTHHLISITDARGSTVTAISYDDQGRVKTYSEYGETWTYTYEPQNNKTYKDDPDGNRWTFSYNDTGQLVSKKDPLGNTITYTWDDKLNLISVKDASGNTTTYTFDPKGNRLSKTDSLGNTTIYTYYSTHEKVSTITDPLGSVTKYEYDSKGNRAKLILDYGGSLQSETIFAYDSNGNPSSLADPLGNTITFAYDTYGNLTRSTDSLGNTTTSTYDIQGNKVTETDTMRNTTIYTYDLLNRMTSVTDSLTNTTTLTYDESGNQRTITNPYGNSLTFTFDGDNRLTEASDPLGNSSQHTYDSRGNQISMTDANGNTTTYIYDVINQLTAETNALGLVTQYTYDANGNKTSFVDANGKTTAFTYDAKNRTVKTVYPDGTFESFSYDAVDNLVARTDRNGNTTTYSYDALNRLITKTYSDGTRSNFTYDLNGNLLTASNPDISYTFSYDTLSRLTSVTNTTLGKTVSYAYLSCGLKSSMTNSEGGVTKYNYDTLMRLTSLTNPLGETTTYTYDKLSKPIRVDLANAAYTTSSYDAVGRLLTLTNTTSKKSVISSYTYSYDNTGNRTSMTTLAGIHNYFYDKIYQLLQATHPTSSAEAYTYDSVHNRLTSTDYNNWTYDQNNRLVSYWDITFSYDNNGNMISKTKVVSSEVTNYQYDYENRLERINYPDGIYSEYAYDPFGNRIKEDVNGTATWFVYDFSKPLPDVIAEYDSNGALLVSYTHGYGIDQVLSMRRGESSYYYIKDGLGSITSLMDRSGTVVNTYLYDSFGNIVTKTGSLSNPYGYTGRRLHSDPDLMYYRDRYYYPSLGRFITVDAEGIDGGKNLYSYVLNNPMRFVDPSGAIAKTKDECWNEYRENIKNADKDFEKCKSEYRKVYPTIKSTFVPIALCVLACGFSGAIALSGTPVLASATFMACLKWYCGPTVVLSGAGNIAYRGIWAWVNCRWDYRTKFNTIHKDYRNCLRGCP